MRGVLAALAIAALVGGCSHDKTPEAVADKTPPEQVLKKDCTNPKWREQNLGLWYSVCRQSAGW